MPSTSVAFSPASRIAFLTAQLPSARVVLVEPRAQVVSPTPTIAYLSRRYLGVVASTSALGNGIYSLPYLSPRSIAPCPSPSRSAAPSPSPQARCGLG